MTDEGFSLKMVTPTRISLHRNIRSLRLMDRTGFFGIMKNHCDFLTVLVPAIGYFVGADGNNHFLAVDAGFFTMRKGLATITSSELFESDDVSRLSDIINVATARKDASDLAILQMVAGIEHAYLEKTAALSRGTS